jgi:hypothetical protein
VPFEEDGVFYPAVFRADWTGDNTLRLGYQSVTFGFTTDLPPTDEVVRIADPEDARRGSGLRPGQPARAAEEFVSYTEGDGVGEQTFPVGAGRGPAPGTGTAAGTVPTPIPPAVSAAGVGGGGAGVGSLGMPFAGGSGFPGTAGVGGIGTAQPGFSGGGGTGGGTGGGSGNPGTGTTSNTGQQTPGETQTMTFAPTLTNSNANTNSQSQTQSQSQSQSQTTSPGEVIPEPGAIILGLLGLPALFLLRRRKAAPAA